MLIAATSSHPVPIPLIQVPKPNYSHLGPHQHQRSSSVLRPPPRAYHNAPPHALAQPAHSTTGPWKPPIGPLPSRLACVQSLVRLGHVRAPAGAKGLWIVGGELSWRGVGGGGGGGAIYSVVSRYCGRERSGRDPLCFLGEVTGE